MRYNCIRLCAMSCEVSWFNDQSVARIKLDYSTEYNNNITNIAIFLPADVFTVIWCSKPSKDKRVTLKRNTVKSSTSAPCAQLP